MNQRNNMPKKAGYVAKKPKKSQSVHKSGLVVKFKNADYREWSEAQRIVKF